MHLGWSLFIWLVIVLLAYIISRKSYVTPRASLVLAVLFGYIYLLIFVPFGSVYDRNNPWMIPYLIVMIISPLILAVFIVRAAIRSKDTKNALLSFKDHSKRAQ